MYLEENSLARCVLPKVRGFALKKKNKLFIDDAATDRMMMVVKSDDTAVCLSLCVGRRGGYGHLVGRTQVLSKLPFFIPFQQHWFGRSRKVSRQGSSVWEFLFWLSPLMYQMYTAMWSKRMFAFILCLFQFSFWSHLFQRSRKKG